MEFLCTLGTVEGRVIEEVHESTSEEAARIELQRRGFHVFKIQRRGILGSLAGLRPGAQARRIKGDTLLLFNQELAALIRAGLPILQALEIMLERQSDPLFRQVLSEVRTKVESGVNLSDAFADFGDLFPRIYSQTLKAGERSGELEQVLRRFVRYVKLVNETRRKVVSALIYPAVLVCLSLVMILVMGIFVMPKFADFFTNLEAELPLMTRVTMGFSTFLQQRWPWVLLALAVATAVFLQVRRSAVGRQWTDRWKLKVPLLGSIFRRMAISELCRSLATLLAGGIPLVSALDSSVNAIANSYIRNKLVPAIGRVTEGQALYTALEKSGQAPSIVLEMTRVGEETGALDSMLTNASDFLDEEVEVRTQRVLTLVEPMMLVFMGLIVALLLVSIYLPLFSALGQVQS